MSQEIAPFAEMLKGVESGLASYHLRRFFLDKSGRPYSFEEGSDILDPLQYKSLIAIGPSALRYLKKYSPSVPLYFGMILNPQKIIGSANSPICGVNLNIPIHDQLLVLKEYFPFMSRLGVLFDPKNNQNWFAAAEAIAAANDLELVPIHIESFAGRLNIVGDLSLPDVLLFIPDKTIISKVVIQYVIKQAAIRHIPVVGYNQYFLDSGAALSFIIDYTQVGRRVAAQVEKSLGAHDCGGIEPPEYSIHINERVWQALKLDERGKTD